MQVLGDSAAWKVGKADDKTITERMLRVALLQARAEEHDSAVELLLRAMNNHPLPTTLHAKLIAAEKAVHSKSRTNELKSNMLHQELYSSNEDRMRLQAAALLLSQGATAPWPAMMITLLRELSDTALRVFSAMIASVDPSRARPRFASAAPVIVWVETKYRWEPGVIRRACGKGLLEVSTSALGSVVLPAKSVLRIAESGAGALLNEAAKKGTIEVSSHTLHTHSSDCRPVMSCT